MVDITNKYARELDISNPMGIPAYDFIVNTYSGTNIATTTYKRGGSSGHQSRLFHIHMTAVTIY